MKKIFMTGLALFMHALYALPVGSPCESSLFRIGEVDPCNSAFFGYEVGFYGDYVFNRHLETDLGRNVDTVKIFTNAAYLALNYKERGEIFATLGASRFSLNTSLVAFNSVDPFPLFELETLSTFSYSIGARSSLFCYKCASLSIEGQYFSTKPNLKRAYIAAGAVAYLDTLNTHYKEWQIGGVLSYRYNPFFIPYVAVKYSRSHWKLADGENIIIESNTDTFFYNLHNRRNWGYAVGLTLCPSFCNKLAITVEARFPDEKALFVNGKILF